MVTFTSNTAIDTALEDIRGTGPSPAHSSLFPVVFLGDSIGAGADAEFGDVDGWAAIFTRAMKAHGGDAGTWMGGHRPEYLADGRATYGRDGRSRTKYYIPERTPFWNVEDIKGSGFLGGIGGVSRYSHFDTSVRGTAPLDASAVLTVFNATAASAVIGIPATENGHWYRPRQEWARSGGSTPSWAAVTGLTYIDGECVWKDLGTGSGYPAWKPYTTYAAESAVTAGGRNYLMMGGTLSCSGTSHSSEPTWPTVVGNKVTDGTVQWVCIATSGGDTASLPQWAASTSYSFGKQVRGLGSSTTSIFMVCGAKLAASAPTFNTGEASYTIDGGICWTEMGEYPLAIRLPAFRDADIVARYGAINTSTRVGTSVAGGGTSLDSLVVDFDGAGQMAGYPYTVNQGGTDAAVYNHVYALPTTSENSEKTLRLRRPAGASTRCTFQGLRLWANAERVGVFDYNLSRSGLALANLASSLTTSALQQEFLGAGVLPVTGARLWVIALGVNDYSSGVSLTTASSALASLIGWIKTFMGLPSSAAAPIVFVHYPPTGTGNGAAVPGVTQYDYLKALSAVALANGAGVLDCSQVFGGGTPDQAQTAGYFAFFDSTAVHPSTRGQDVIGNEIVDALGLELPDYSERTSLTQSDLDLIRGQVETVLATVPESLEAIEKAVRPPKRVTQGVGIPRRVTTYDEDGTTILTDYDVTVSSDRDTITEARRD